MSINIEALKPYLINRIIDFDKYICFDESSLLGRENGELVLKKILFYYDLPKLEKVSDKIIIRIPERIITINKSFFLGIFETIIYRLGKNEFIEKYKFETSNYLQDKILKYIDSAMLKAGQEEILLNN